MIYGKFESFLMWFWGCCGYFIGDGVWIFALKWGNYRKVYRKILSEFWVILIFFISVMGKWDRLCVEMPLAKFSELSDSKKCKIPPSYFWRMTIVKNPLFMGYFLHFSKKCNLICGTGIFSPPYETKILLGYW